MQPSNTADPSTRRSWEDAVRACQGILAVQADDLAATLRLGGLYSAAQQSAQAVRLYERALRVRPHNARLHHCLGAALHRMGQTGRAIDCFARAIRLRPNQPAVRKDFALVLRRLGRTKEALVHLQKAVGLKPEDAEAQIGMALTFRQQGRAALAAETLQRLLALRPACGAAYYHLSLMRPNRRLEAAVRELLAVPNLPPADAIHGHFALGNCLDSRRSFAEAFDHYRQANALERRSFAYDANDNRALFERLCGVYCKRFFQDVRGLGAPSQLPVFIVGLPRSGTTLVEQIVSSHPAVHGAGEIEALAGINQAIAERLGSSRPVPECMADIDGALIEEHAAQYLRELVMHSTTAARITDKSPGNFVRIGLIKTLFPQARIICCQRNPLDNCLSLFFHCFKALKCSFRLDELGLYCLDQQRLMAHWEELFPGEMLKVRYEELVTAQECVSRRIVDYLGLEWDQRCLDFHNNDRAVMSPSAMQVRQPLYRRSLGRWKPYAAHLQPLMEVLRD